VGERPTAAATTLTGDGALTMFSQTAAGAEALVSFCVALYDIPPSNRVAGSLQDIRIPGSQPIVLGGAAYVPPTHPSTGGDWPTSATQTSFTFRFIPANTTASLAAGDRVAIRIYVKVNLNVPIDLVYDNPDYPASLQLNSQ